ncbi:hypothetical protein VP1G_04095 [Cytospora mali]|uniref:DUF7918 domain-containing protein n=1 Tax=Cytospora mali TaxID=578113 RepID=A0A194UYP3_CYTMA|nr:hypothetical protein VP1G_04095 [Valsa mali var. pyri (nom. inval.)]
MPSLRGIEVSVLAQLEAEELPEYPHPDGSSAYLRGLNDTAGDNSPRAAPDVEPALLTRSNPTVAVYIPSLPGAQFWINYVVEREPTPPGHLFFKLYMNGRHITSWGINPRIKTKGQVEKALYEPSERWDHEENGTVIKQTGIEARYFHFVGGQQEKSVAEDGGLIEVQVFRAKGRKRRAAKLDQYRHQDKYGIAAPSGGLLENPQDVTFFDFHLIDPKDSPFASFRFHYRSWENLCQLNFIPRNDSSISGSFSINTDTPDIDPIVSDDGALQEKSSPVPTLAHPDPDESVFDDSDSSEEHFKPNEGNSKPRRNSTFTLRTPPQLRPRSATSHNLPQPSKTLRDGAPHGVPDSYLQRPLPVRPLPDLPICGTDSSWASRSRNSSTTSAAPSVTPSLRSYVKDGSFLEDSVEYGQAQEVHIRKGNPRASPCQDGASPDHNDTSISDYESSPPAEEDSKESELLLLSPGNYLARTGSMLENHIAQIESKHESPTVEIDRSAIPNPQDASRNCSEMALDFSKFPHLQLSEADWIRRTPSPTTIHRGILSPKRLWNTLRRNKSRSPLRDLPGNEVMARNKSTPNLAGKERNEKYSNWI